MSGCSYPSCQMGGQGCSRESTCDEDMNKEKGVAKTKEKVIEVWVCLDSKSEPTAMKMWNKKHSEMCDTKARLIIELPEKSVTLTESEFDEAVQSLRIGGNEDPGECISELKERLFARGEA